MGRFTGDEGQFLDTEEAGQFTGAYKERKRKQGIPDPECVRSEFFGINNLQELLAQPGCVGVRVYHAKRYEDYFGNPAEEGQGSLRPRVVLVGVDAQGNDLVNAAEAGMKDMPTGRRRVGFLGKGPVCPPECQGGGTGTDG